jgi:hypothetical protein
MTRRRPTPEAEACARIIVEAVEDERERVALVKQLGAALGLAPMPGCVIHPNCDGGVPKQ